MNKRGQFDIARKTIYWIIAGVIITMVVLTFAITMAGYKSKLTQIPPELKAELTAFRFTNIPECFALYESNTGRTMSGVIDLSKFNQTVMDQCYKTDDSTTGIRQMNFQLKLQNINKVVSTNNYRNVNKDKLTIHKEVLVWNNNKITKDILIIFVQDL